jgi:peptide chain release factor subunit 1
MNTEEDLEYERNVEMYKLKKLINRLDTLKGSGTSMITLIINYKDQINQYMKMLVEEVGKASNIKSRVTRQNVTDALTSTMEKLKLYNRTPINGLVIYCGLVQTEDGGEKMVKMDLTPFKPINTSLYKCDSVFHTEEIKKLLEDNDRFGFIIMDGNGSLFGTVQGNTRTVLLKFTVDLPKKHGRGGQSANRFARIRTERRHNYVRKVAESATACFITNDRPNVKGLILAGSAEFKNDLQKSDLFDPRLQPTVLKIVDISYGGENGFNQAIELSADTLRSVKFIHEKKVIGRFFDEIAKDSGKYVFGLKDTLEAMENGCIDILIIWENMEFHRLTLKDNAENVVVEIIPKSKSTNSSKWKNELTGVEYEVLENVQLTEWFLEFYKKYVTHMEIITDKSSEGAQFVKGFGGVGGILRYKVDINYDEVENDNGFNDDDFI